MEDSEGIAPPTVNVSKKQQWQDLSEMKELNIPLQKLPPKLADSISILRLKVDEYMRLTRNCDRPASATLPIAYVQRAGNNDDSFIVSPRDKVKIRKIKRPQSARLSSNIPIPNKKMKIFALFFKISSPCCEVEQAFSTFFGFCV